MSLEAALCADGCGRLAETERPTADGRIEQVCTRCLAGFVDLWPTREHATPLEDR